LLNTTSPGPSKGTSDRRPRRLIFVGVARADTRGEGANPRPYDKTPKKDQAAMSSTTTLFHVLPFSAVTDILRSGDRRIVEVHRLEWWSDQHAQEMALTFHKIPAGTYRVTDNWSPTAEDPTWAVTEELDGEYLWVVPHATFHGADHEFWPRMESRCNGIRRDDNLHGSLSGLRLDGHPDMIRGVIPVESFDDFDDED
jgi:hypothetical protein